MKTFVSLLAAASVASIALAGPLPESHTISKRVTIHQSVPKKGKSGAQALAAAHAKFGKDVPTEIASAASTESYDDSGSGSVVANPEQYDSEYLCPVTVGGQTVHLDFDTGSADLWVFSSEQPESQSSGHEIYTPSKSSTSKKLSGATWKISYGDGSGASGDVYTDTVTVGGVTVTKQAVEAAKTVSSEFLQDDNNDGLLGLAFSSINTVTPQAQTTFFDSAISEGALSSSLFAVDLKAGKPGSYDFGYIDDSKYTGDIAYTDVDSSQGFWSFTASGYGVGSDNFNSQSVTGIADTGTSLILVDDDIVSAYYNGVNGASYDNSQGGYTFPCSTELPDFILGVGDAKFTVPGSYMNFAPTSGDNCFGGIQSSSSVGINIFGDVFLKAVYTVFDNNGPRLGFASKTL